MVRLIVALVLVSAIGCAVANTGTREPSRVGPTRTLCVEDLSAGFGTITVRTSTGVRFDPWPGERVCKTVTVPLRMSVTSIGGGMAGPLRGYMVFKATGGPCMSWRIRGVRDAEMDFVPCHWGH